MQAAQHRQFEIHHCLGRGGFGEVYRATMVSPGGLRTRVALKVLRVDVDPGGDAVRRLRDEGKLLAALHHPAILQAFDMALLDGRVGLVTEYVEGEDLHDCVLDEGGLPVRCAVEVVGVIAEALDAAWNRTGESGDPLHLIHRDVKPSNIRLGHHGEVKLLDFGIARSDEVDREARTGTGSTVGSLAYMAPERFSREPPGPEGDIYALGCVLFEALSGERLHPDPVPVEMFRLAATASAHARHVEERLQLLTEVSPPVLSLLRDMLDHDRAARPTSREVANRCEGVVESSSGISLKRWAREREWRATEEEQGAFDGRVITEGTLGSQSDSLLLPAETYAFDPGTFEDPPHAVAEAVADEATQGGEKHVVIALLLTVILVVLSILWWAQSSLDLAVNMEVASELPVTIAPSVVESSTVVETSPVGEPSPVVEPPSPVESPSRVEQPPVVAPSVIPTPHPSPAHLTEASVPTQKEVESTQAPAEPKRLRGTIKGDVRGIKVVLVKGSERVKFNGGSQSVSVGTYNLELNGQRVSTRVTISEGTVTEIVCNPLLTTCE